MSTVYSLICFGGRTGKTVTFTDAGDVVNLTSHGLRPGAGVVFSTTGSLPTGLTAGTTYYAKQGADANKFLLYPTSADAIAGSNQVTFSGTGSGTHTVKGAYFSGLTSDQKARYGSSGSERIYDGLAAWNSGRSGASKLDVEVCEIGEAWDDWLASQLTINVPAGAIRIETRVAGARSSGFHGGQISSGTTNYGYVARRINYSDAAIVFGTANITIDGITVMRESGGYGPTGITATAGFRGFVINTIAIGLSGSGTGISGPGVAGGLINCLSTGWGTGISVPTYAEGVMLANCTAVKNTNGIMGSANYQPCYAYVYNTIALGNTTTNWDTSATVASGFRYCTNNAGGTGEAWKTTTGSRVEITEASPFSATFTNFTSNDFTPKDTSSQLVDAGAEYYGAYAYDVADDVRPSYENGTTTYYDIGAFEFDHGYGLAPVTISLSFPGVVSTSEIRIYKVSDGSEVAGVESCSADHEFSLTYSGDLAVVIRIVHTSYKIKEFNYTITSGDQSLPVQQELDKWYSNPA